MNEIPADALWIGAERRTVHADGLRDVEVIDAGSLACRYRGAAPVVLHYGGSPKAWERHAWSRVRPDDAYIRLLPRVLFAPDVQVRARLIEVPIWLWPRGVGRVAVVVVRLLYAVGALNLVRRLRDRGRLLRDRLFRLRSERGKLPDPTQPVFSIGIYDGRSPLELVPAIAPALTGDDVSHVVASNVADPFLLRADGVWHMFFEVWNWRENKGEIGLATSGDALRWRYGQIVLAEEFHLSYPYVFEWEGERWLVPESFQAASVRLYRADPFPERWVLAATLIEAPYVVDASPFRFDDRWWLFAETSPDHDTLRLYHAEALDGPWHEHPSSPVVAGDASKSRPAGRVLVDGDRIIRFAQDCSRVYGELVRAFEVTELTTSSYAERELAGPVLAGSGAGWNARGMHHLDAQRLPDGRWLAAVDGWR
jgi:hypothetical protein